MSPLLPKRGNEAPGYIGSLPPVPRARWTEPALDPRGRGTGFPLAAATARGLKLRGKMSRVERGG